MPGYPLHTLSFEFFSLIHDFLIISSNQNIYSLIYRSRLFTKKYVSSCGFIQLSFDFLQVISLKFEEFS
jgi:hypothetical protein